MINSAHVPSYAYIYIFDSKTHTLSHLLTLLFPSARNCTKIIHFITPHTWNDEASRAIGRSRIIHANQSAHIAHTMHPPEGTSFSEIIYIYSITAPQRRMQMRECVFFGFVPVVVFVISRHPEWPPAPKQYTASHTQHQIATRNRSAPSIYGCCNIAISHTFCVNYKMYSKYKLAHDLPRVPGQCASLRKTTTQGNAQPWSDVFFVVRLSNNVIKLHGNSQCLRTYI